MGDFVDVFGFLLDGKTGNFVRCKICSAQIKSYPEIGKRYCTDYLSHEWW